jgi:hypothetical protein
MKIKERILTYLVVLVAVVAVNFVFATDQKITELAAITSLADNDLLVVVDVSDTTMAATGTNKKITWANLEAGIDIADLDGYVAEEHIDWTVDQSPTYAIHANNITGIPASAITSGTLVHERGGLEADVSGYSGLVAISGGATSEVDSKSELEAQIADVSDFAEADGDTYTGTHDFTGATLLAKFKLILTGEAITCASNVCTMSASYTSHYVTTENNSAADVLAVADSATVGTIFRFALTVDGGDAVEVTPASFANGTKFTLNDAGESVTLQWGGTGGWFIVGSHESGDGGLS